MYKLINRIIIFVILLTNILITCTIDKNKFVKNPRVILIDGGQTLVTFDTIKALKHISSYSSWMFFLKSAITGNLNLADYLSNFYFETLSKIPCPVKFQYQKVIAPNGKFFAPLQIAFLTGKLTQRDAIKTAHDWANKNKNEFESATLQNIFIQLISLNFDSDILINHLKPNFTMDSLQKYFNERDNTGKRKNICIVIGNHSKEFIPYLKRNFPQIFQFSDAQIFSGNEGFLKPDLKLFEKALSLCPNNCQNNCIFIDEQKSVLNIIHRKKVSGYILNSFLPNEFKSLN